MYRWQADPAFVAAIEAAADDYFRRHRAKVLAEMADRRPGGSSGAPIAGLRSRATE